MKLIKEFKEFAVKGNMMDMAIGIIIGVAFNAVVDVLVKQILMPPLSLLTEGVKLSDKKIVLREAFINSNGEIISAEVAIAYGALFEALLDFFVIGVVVFIIVKFMNRLRKKAQDINDVSVVTPKDIELLSDLKNLMQEQNDLLKNRKSDLRS
ncbi:large conductance mechanosensitive channel protein MscL [Mesohalobacter halotolerans]|uniref:Large-conductance mechanosensitive channel n=1 Tax=Mesohalobacter halotolerans TaxID=1883405 RepID=A0A4U5TR75_9FLAO|nr:large conductance mechanosensitive channel protein MscL [Mesohalobacter halotolerans]MBS3737856.1 large conductance mechanosensitive channel protein MscL [Psychroflexus sp.]TKS56740.1 large conductance mechanosensitive channel protein MscL [Mesohalobacter halotolerans]